MKPSTSGCSNSILAYLVSSPVVTWDLQMQSDGVSTKEGSHLICSSRRTGKCQSSSAVGSRAGIYSLTTYWPKGVTQRLTLPVHSICLALLWPWNKILLPLWIYTMFKYSALIVSLASTLCSCVSSGTKLTLLIDFLDVNSVYLAFPVRLPHSARQMGPGIEWYSILCRLEPAQIRKIR